MRQAFIVTERPQDTSTIIDESYGNREAAWVVTDSADGTPVWYVVDNDLRWATPRPDDSELAVSFRHGVTWPRTTDREPAYAKAMALATVEKLFLFNENADGRDMAYNAGLELIDDPQGWCRFVPEGQCAGDWLKQFNCCIAVEWREKQRQMGS